MTLKGKPKLELVLVQIDVSPVAKKMNTKATEGQKDIIPPYYLCFDHPAN